MIDPEAVGRAYQVTVHTTLMLRNRETIEAFEAALVPLEEVVEAQRMFGDPDYLIRVAVADAAAYEQFLINTFADLPGLARMTSQFTMKTIKPGGRLPLMQVRHVVAHEAGRLRELRLASLQADPGAFGAHLRARLGTPASGGSAARGCRRGASSARSWSSTTRTAGSGWPSCAPTTSRPATPS